VAKDGGRNEGDAEDGSGRREVAEVEDSRRAIVGHDSVGEEDGWGERGRGQFVKDQKGRRKRRTLNEDIRGKLQTDVNDGHRNQRPEENERLAWKDAECPESENEVCRENGEAETAREEGISECETEGGEEETYPTGRNRAPEQALDE
jgi:hypothetical protein